MAALDERRVLGQVEGVVAAAREHAGERLPGGLDAEAGRSADPDADLGPVRVQVEIGTVTSSFESRTVDAACHTCSHDADHRKSPLVVLGVTGCIAAYKACELARTLMRAGCRVKVVMTEAATRFVGPTTFRALTGEPVAVGLWDEADARVHHISLAEEADVFAVVPATANTLAKLACGRADDLLSTTALATEATLVLAPAMNVHMWRAERDAGGSRRRCARAARSSSRPRAASSPAATSGRAGSRASTRSPRRSSPRRDARAISRACACSSPPVRPASRSTRSASSSNASSGKTGYAIAEEAARRGATVTLVSGPTALPDPFGVHTVRVTTAEQMRLACCSGLSGVRRGGCDRCGLGLPTGRSRTRTSRRRRRAELADRD